MAETATELELAIDQQRALFDLDLRASVSAIQNAASLSAASPSSDAFEGALRAVVSGNRNIRSLRVLDEAGRELLVIRGTAGSAPSVLKKRESASGEVFSDEDFLDQIRTLPAGEVMVSEFTGIDEGEGREPAIRLGVGLFFPSGARAGYIVATVSADGILDNMHRLQEEDADLFIVSQEGEWVYDSRSAEGWSSLLNFNAERWMSDEYPEVWKRMISSEADSVVEDGVWIFRRHTPFEMVGSDSPGVLRPGGEGDDGISSEAFYVVKRVEEGPTWAEIWSSMIPVFLLYALTVMIVIPALFRSRRALLLSEQSGRKLAEASLKTRMAMEAARISEWSIDLENGTVETDKRTTSMLLLGEEESLKTIDDWKTRIHPQEQRKVFDQLEKIWSEGTGSFSYRHRMRRGDGSWGWYRFRGAVRADRKTGTKLIFGAYLNVTESILREGELRRLELATRQTLSGIAILDNEGRLDWSNEAFYEMPGRGDGKIIGQPIWELLDLSGEKADAEKKFIRSAVLRGEEFSLTITHAAGDAELSWTRVVGNPVLDESGIPTHYVVVESDMTREKRADLELRKSDSLLRESQRIAGIGSWEIDVEEGTSFWTEEIYEIFGLPADSSPDTDRTLELIDPEFREVIRESTRRAIEEGTGFEREFSFHRPDGEQRWAESIGMAIREKGVTSKVYGVTQDITERKEAEASLIKAKEEEEVLNKQLVAALDKARLSERKAKEASEAKSAFLSMISHEIRNPLNGVLGMADIMKATSLDGTQQSYLEAIHSSGSTVVMLLDDILDYNRLEHGKIEFEQKSFSIERAAEDSIMIFSAKMAQKGLDIGFWVDPAVPHRVTGDITRVKQIFFNLIGNAVKFTQTGSINVEVKLRERLPNDRSLMEISVSDTGIGIPRDRHDRIFQTFSQVDPSVTRRFGGSGLGLSISRELAMRMGGNIEFESEEGEGTCFKVTLPFLSTFSETKKEVLESGQAIGCFRSVLRGKQVRTSLEQAGLSVKTFEEPAGFAKALSEVDRKTWVFLDREVARSKDIRNVLKDRPRDSQPVIVFGWPEKEETLPCPNEWTSLPVTPSKIRKILEDQKEDFSGKEDVSSSKRSSIQKKSKPVSKLKILVAEDNAVNQKVIRLLLKRLGYDCTMVENGRLAVDKVKSETFDLVLMDIQMPELDGIEASQEISQEVPANRRPRIVALTAGATRDNREDAEGAGMKGYLTKPIELEALTAELGATKEYLRERAELAS